jgi:hypothetical protein
MRASNGVQKLIFVFMEWRILRLPFAGASHPLLSQELAARKQNRNGAADYPSWVDQEADLPLPNGPTGLDKQMPVSPIIEASGRGGDATAASAGIHTESCPGNPRAESRKNRGEKPSARFCPAGSNANGRRRSWFGWRWCRGDGWMDGWKRPAPRGAAVSGHVPPRLIPCTNPTHQPGSERLVIARCGRRHDY